MDAEIATILAAAVTGTLAAAAGLGAACLTFLAGKRTRQLEAQKLEAERQRDEEAESHRRDILRRQQLDEEYRMIRQREQEHLQRLLDELDRLRKIIERGTQ